MFTHQYFDETAYTWQSEWCCHCAGLAVSCAIVDEVAVCTVTELGGAGLALLASQQELVKRLLGSELVGNRKSMAWWRGPAVDFGSFEQVTQIWTANVDGNPTFWP